METLPFEILTEVLSHLGPSNRKAARLTSHRFNAALARSSFAILASFVDPDVAIATIETVASNLKKRPRSIWSPRCSVPDGLPIPESFMLAMYTALEGCSWPAPGTRSSRSWRRGTDCLPAWDTNNSSSSSGGSEAGSDMENFSDDESSLVGLDSGHVDDIGCITTQDFSGKFCSKDAAEDVLRQALFRYSLYMSYRYEGDGVAPQLWVCDSRKWADRV